MTALNANIKVISPPLTLMNKLLSTSLARAPNSICDLTCCIAISGSTNIMLVSKQTLNIGISKAIGAKRHHILLQFLIEALLLSLLGGVIGLTLGDGLVTLISSSIPGFPPACIPFWSIALPLGFSGFVSVLFGILPAAKAANLAPIDALRYE